MPENPPAFPGGMKLRDYFAGQAIAGWMAEMKSANVTDPGWHKWSADRCYEIADAMLAAREKKPEASDALA